MTGSESEWPMTFALGAPQRGQTMPEVVRLAMWKGAPLISLDEGQGEKTHESLFYFTNSARPPATSAVAGSAAPAC
jgi:hypothetical protein